MHFVIIILIITLIRAKARASLSRSGFRWSEGGI